MKNLFANALMSTSLSLLSTPILASEASTLSSTNYLLEVNYAFLKSKALHAIVHLHVADIMETHSFYTIDQIIDGLKKTYSIQIIKRDYLEDLLQILISHNIFKSKMSEANQNLYGHNDVSHLLKFDHPNSISKIVLKETDPYRWSKFNQIQHIIAPSIQDLPAEEYTSLYDYYTSNPCANKIFQDGMEQFSLIENQQVAHFFINHVENRLINNSILDIGGGKGDLVHKILSLSSDLFSQVDLFDLPDTVNNHQLAQWMKKNKSHVLSGSFFDANFKFINVPSYNNIILKRVLHNWNDERCLEILEFAKNFATKNSETRIFVIEGIKEYNLKKPSLFQDGLALTMSFKGSERTAEDFEKIALKAKLKLVKIHSTTTMVQILEFSLI